MPVPHEILGLVGRFENNREAYRSGAYNETQLRREFVDPFFGILGWDVNNEKGYAEAYKDVIHEDSIKVGGVTKAPDYCFRIGGTRKFFVETKKPSVNLRDDISPAFQLRRYAWSAKLPLSILTDFEEFAVYDCRVKPDKSDKSSTARILYLTYTEYAQRWEEISQIFSRDAVLKGSFDKYAESSKVKKGTASVDDAFLKEIESWRDMLARNLALRNPDLTQYDLNFTVQRTIDRIVFLRICEDRGIEKYGRLMALQNGDRVYARLCEMFHRADERYNSGLFHFQKDKSRAESPDTLTLNVTVDDSALKNIIKNLYYPDSPYEFSVLSSDILGQVYEQFLGKVIRLTAGHRAVVEEKPEVRKAGGVYYTPTYIVDYIVKNTVGKLVRAENFQPLRKTTPKEISKIRILDPACGSGSFLLGAYQYLLDWHRDWYVADGPEKWATGRSPTLYQIADSNLPQPHSPLAGSGLQPEPNISVQSGTIEPAEAEKSPPGRGLRGGSQNPNSQTCPRLLSGIGNWHLTTAERKRILLNNIYGVDIDPQAVEVTKLSLLLKVLEGESEQTLARQLKLFHERALPDLGNNVKCGNSLIGTDFYNTPLTPLFRGEKMDSPLARGAGGVSDEERRKVNPFDWEAEFPEIMKTAPAGREQGSGGFDVVIGNPPYVRQEGLGDLKEYFQRKYTVYHGMADLYAYFIEKGVSLLRDKGTFGYIVANKWMRANYGEPLRKWLRRQCIAQIVDFGDLPVFQQATTYPCILVIGKDKPSFVSPDGSGLQPEPNILVQSKTTEPARSAKKPTTTFSVTQAKTLKFDSLENYVKENRYLINFTDLDDKGWSLLGSQEHSLIKKLKTKGIALSKFIKGKINYGIKTGLNEAFVIDKETRNRLISEDRKSAEIIKPFLLGRDIKRYQSPLIEQYLIFIPKGWTREKAGNTSDAWNWLCKSYLSIANHLSSFADAAKKRYDKGDYWWELRACDYYNEFEKPKICWGNLCTYSQFTYTEEILYINAPACIISTNDLYLLGLINSKPIWYFLSKIAAGRQGGFIEAKPMYVSQIPIRTINFSDLDDKARHDHMVALVGQMLELHKQLASARTDHEKTAIQRQIDATDRQIDQLVCELYGLTEEEIKIVEEGSP